MKILVIGSSGFVGSHLTRYLISQGHQIVGVDMAANPQAKESELFQFVRADTTVPGLWRAPVGKVNVVINLAGKNIFNRWNEQYKKLIYDSRILTTKHIVESIPDRANIVLISTSAVGYYGDQKDAVLDEDASHGDDFLSRVCIDWEKEANKAKDKGSRVVIARFGGVLGKNGGLLSKMVPVFKMFMGGPLGDGRHWFSWIHINDLLNAIKFIMDHQDIEGPVNFCSPQPVRNEDFSKALAKILGRPAVIRVPAFMVKLAAGELGDLAIYSQRVRPAKLLSAGFEFEYPDVESALAASVT